ncbi:hypothetical protein K443DRAFT_121693 [Laccaria amethystina LaAM-08-1]|uniref:DUF6534 domain-containing protein n=1 Tax=Laccaria amethystina LaAM-08-1 TaxID=1095629 RepID=A0A0C9Y4L7_9AGAR|nr:hypothetical protein K443DRAFT_121693 [Laccaria amethystina LaAM-08-1]
MLCGAAETRSAGQQPIETVTVTIKFPQADMLRLQLWLCESNEAPELQARSLQGLTEAESPRCRNNLASCSPTLKVLRLNQLQVSRLRILQLIILPWVTFTMAVGYRVPPSRNVPPSMFTRFIVIEYKTATCEAMLPLSIIESSLGAAFLGSVAASVLYGITSVQTFFYFRNTHEDGRLFKLLVLGYITFGLHCTWNVFLYCYMYWKSKSPSISNLDPAGHKARKLINVILSVRERSSRSVFARRVWLLKGGKKMGKIILPVLIVLISLFVFVCAVGNFRIATYARMDQISYLLYCSLGGSVAADVLVAGSLCALLFGNRTGFKRICAIACFVTYALWPQRLIFMGVYFALSKLYINSLLASLNARGLLRDKGYGVSTIPSCMVATPFSCCPLTTSCDPNTNVGGCTPEM